MKMIIAKPIVPKKSRFLHACVVLGTLTLLPLGLASARDYEAVQKRLQKSVKEGDLTQAEAKLMMEALKKSAEKDHQKKGALNREEIGEIGKKIRAAVAAGEMTKEEGRKKMAVLIEGYHAQGESGKLKEMDAEGFRRRLGAAVEAGKITREEAAEKMAEFLGRGSNERGIENLDREGIGKRIEGAVEDGKISRQEADAKYRKIKDQASVGGEARDGDKERSRERSRGRKGEGGREVDWESIKERIEGAVKDGKISREQADANYRELKKRTSEVKRRGVVDLDAFGRQLRAMVEAGKLSKEDARAKMESLRKRAASKNSGETKERK